MTAARWVVVGACALAAALAGCGDSSDSTTTQSGDDAFTKVAKQPSLTQTARRAAPRWERLTVMSGTGAAERGLTISPRAIQWRARWSCEGSGKLALSTDPAPRTPPEKPGGDCPGRGETTWVQTGEQTLRVEGSGRWNVIVEQQVDTPLREKPLAAMAAATVLARGTFYPVERQGRGEAILYELRDGRTALRLQNFRTSSNTDLFVWLSTAAKPKTTKAAVRAPRVGRLLPLKSTIGEQNYILPKNADPDRIRSIVIWCVPIQIVYTAADLRR